MNTRRLLALLVACTVAMTVFAALTLDQRRTAGANTGQANESRPEPVFQEVPTNQLVVKYESDVTSRAGLAPHAVQLLSQVSGVALEHVRTMSGEVQVLRLPGRMPASVVEAIARRIADLPGVEYAEPDRIMLPTLAPNDPAYGSQWHYHEQYGANVAAAWAITTGSNATKVAVIDSGITDHPDLAGRWVGGYDFIADVPTANDGDGRDGDPHDPGDWITATDAAAGQFAGCAITNSSWHGTHVAGVVGASTNNGSGVAGINWAAGIVPVRVLGKCGGYISDTVDAMRWAAGLAVAGTPANANPAKVLALSLGGIGVCSASYQDAIDDINALGAIIVVGTGNSSSNLNNYSFQPANCNGVIAVAATNRSGDKATYSNFGATVEISAPGGDIYSGSPGPAPENGVLSTLNAGLTTPGAAAYGYYQGTSSSVPHVAGALSLMVSLDASLDFTRSLQVLQFTARPFPAGSSCSTAICGSGIVDAAAALRALDIPAATATAAVTPTTIPLPTYTPATPAPETSTSTPLAATATATATPHPTATTQPQVTPLPVLQDHTVHLPVVAK